MATELFAPHRLDALQGLRSNKMRELVAHIARLARDGVEVDVGRVAFTTSLNLLSGTIFSKDLASLDDHGGSKEFQALVSEAMKCGGSPNVSDFFPVLARADLQGLRRRLAQLLARLHQVFDAEVDRRLRGREVGETRKEHDDFLDVLLDVAERDGGKAGLDRDTLRALFTVTTNSLLSTIRFHCRRLARATNKFEFSTLFGCVCVPSLSPRVQSTSPSKAAI
jgi:hypothetical protein